ncbi:MAG: hypothetical protein R2816_02720 [Flavobacteriaceae bacterium]
MVWRKINKVNINSLQVTNIPFEVSTKIKIAKAVEFDTPVAPDTFKAKVIRDVKTSPNGRNIVFNALGYLYTMQLPNGTPKRLTSGNDFEFEPSYSKDGSQIVYVTWNDENLGNIYIISSNGGNPTKISSGKGIYRNPSFSNDGKKITYRKEGGNGDQGRTFDKNPGLYIVNSNGTNNQFLTRQGDYPMFSNDDKRIIYQNGGTFGGAITKELKSVDLTGNDERTLIKSSHGNRLLPSPDGKWVAFIHLFKVYMAPMPQAGASIDLTDKTSFVPVTQLTEDAGINLHWSNDSKTLYWTLGNQYFSASASSETKLITKPTTTINLEVKTDKPNGVIAFKNARIITMHGDKVIENGTIIVNQNKIQAIGNASEITIPSNAKVYDVSGKPSCHNC